MNPPEHSRSPGESIARGEADRLLLDGLNEAQVRAVTHGGGPLLVLAGAGSGKTRVITHRIAHLVLACGVRPSRVVAVTFTNKAAAEMRERVERLLGSRVVGGWIGTFHALCLRILRRDGARIGLEPGFAIYDTDDQLALVKRILKAEGIEPATGTPRSFLSRISRAKNALQSPDDLERTAHSPEAKLRAQIYRLYDEALRRANVVDFDDLLVRTLDLFNRDADVAAGYAGRCEHLLVDEYQDTNRPQYLLIRHLTAKHHNICVVGDEDQSIYRFRGAEIRNILEFEADHPGTCTIRLEQNYRSSGRIIGAAAAFIANNVVRTGKTLWTNNPSGHKLELLRAPDDRSEAIWVARRIGDLERNSSYEDMAVLYRTNAQSRQLEEIFRRDKIPYQIVGSVQFYARKEIKDLLAYLQLAANPADDVSFRRAVNTPPRGIGETTLRRIADVARATALPFMEASAYALDQDLLAGRSAKRLQAFLDFVADLLPRADDRPVADLLEGLVDAIGYEAYLEKTYPGVSAERVENVQALISAAVEYAEEVDEDASLQGFLDRSALVAGADEIGDRPGVTLMTIHCAKGLEFPTIFLVGLEEGIFPHAMASDTVEDLEEERRLCYVAMTRAKQRLLLTHARLRRHQGALLPHPPSRFIDEIPTEAIEEVTDDEAGFFGDWEVRAASPAYSGGSSAARVARSSGAPRPGAVPPRPAQPAPGDGYAVGALVMHPRFGPGTILDRAGSGKHLKLTILFSDHGRKKILPTYTKLLIETR